MKLLRILSIVSLSLAVILCSGITVTGPNAGQGRDIPEDGFLPDQTLLASVLGYERDLSCRKGPNSVGGEHWVCPEDAVVLRPIPGRTQRKGYEDYLLKYGSGDDNGAVLALCVFGVVGLFFVYGSPTPKGCAPLLNSPVDE